MTAPWCDIKLSAYYGDGFRFSNFFRKITRKFLKNIVYLTLNTFQNNMTFEKNIIYNFFPSGQHISGIKALISR